MVLDETDIELPDLLTDLQDRTHLTRRTITSILTGSGRLDDLACVKLVKQFYQTGEARLADWDVPKEAE